MLFNGAINQSTCFCTRRESVAWFVRYTPVNNFLLNYLNPICVTPVRATKLAITSQTKYKTYIYFLL